LALANPEKAGSNLPPLKDPRGALPRTVAPWHGSGVTRQVDERTQHPCASGCTCGDGRNVESRAQLGVVRRSANEGQLRSKGKVAGAEAGAEEKLYQREKSKGHAFEGGAAILGNAFSITIHLVRCTTADHGISAWMLGAWMLIANSDLPQL